MATKLVNMQHGGNRGNQYTGGKTEISALIYQPEAVCEGVSYLVLANREIKSPKNRIK